MLPAARETSSKVTQCTHAPAWRGEKGIQDDARTAPATGQATHRRAVPQEAPVDSLRDAQYHQYTVYWHDHSRYTDMEGSQSDLVERHGVLLTVDLPNALQNARGWRNDNAAHDLHDVLLIIAWPAHALGRACLSDGAWGREGRGCWCQDAHPCPALRSPSLKSYRFHWRVHRRLLPLLRVPSTCADWTCYDEKNKAVWRWVKLRSRS